MADSCVPTTPCGLVAIQSEDRRSLAVDVAIEIELAKERFLAAVFGTMSLAVTGVTIVGGVSVFGIGPLLCLVFVLAATLGVSLTLATAALTGTALDAAGRLYWRRVAARYGLDPEGAEGALEDARQQLQALEAKRVAAARNAAGWWREVRPAAPSPPDVR
jgi:hypothetical protein